MHAFPTTTGSPGPEEPSRPCRSALADFTLKMRVVCRRIVTRHWMSPVSGSILSQVIAQIALPRAAVSGGNRTFTGWSAYVGHEPGMGGITARRYLDRMAETQQIELSSQRFGIEGEQLEDVQ